MTLPRFGGPVQLRGDGFLSPLRLPVSPRSRAIPINDLGGFVKKRFAKHPLAFCKFCSPASQGIFSTQLGSFRIAIDAYIIAQIDVNRSHGRRLYAERSHRVGGSLLPAVGGATFILEDCYPKYSRPCSVDQKVVAMGFESQLEKLEERIAANTARLKAFKLQRAILRPGALGEHNRSIDQLDR